jgi:hypothetical protein
MMRNTLPPLASNDLLGSFIVISPGLLAQFMGGDD